MQLRSTHTHTHNKHVAHTNQPNKQTHGNKQQTGDYVFNVLMWSQRLLYEHADQQAAAAAAEGSSLKGRFKGLLGW